MLMMIFGWFMLTKMFIDDDDYYVNENVYDDDDYVNVTAFDNDIE